MGNAAVGGACPADAVGFGRRGLLSTLFSDDFGDAGCTRIMDSLGVTPVVARAADPEFAFS